ncbi:MAG: hypothetical protein DSM106950_22590 [Stigonema ocellatum SAG 48.90 = DSM 106950]|nr:hypothetical protein [Stigonema ocellatum SAG 48.90 = DSM 106950]
MNLPLVLDIATGLIFVYLILSLLASELQELLSTVLQWRAKHLQKSIESLLSGGSEADSTDSQDDMQKAKQLVQELYNDPLINTLNHEAVGRVAKNFRKVSKKFAQEKIACKSSAASYIPSETFASTLLQALKLPDLIEKVQKGSGESKANLSIVLASYKELKTAIQTPESESYKKIKQIYGDIDDELKKTINSLPDNVPNSVLTSLSVLAKRSQIKAKEIDEELNQFRQEVETWFDRSMERASGVYKRNAKGIAILIGLTIAALTNTDTFHIVSRLSRDTAVRTALTQNAVQQPNFNDPDVRNRFYQDLDGVSLPIGWANDNLNQQYELKHPAQWDNSKIWLLRIFQFFRMILGWIVSGIAISMGAPFWFDLLNKFINVRNTGPKPETYTKDRPPYK